MTTQSNRPDHPSPAPPSTIPHRAKPTVKWITFQVLICTSVILSYADRTNIGIAIVPMADEFDWSSRTKGSVLGAFFFGYIATQVVGGWWADRWGGGVVLLMGVGLWSVATVVLPAAARGAGLYGAIAARVALGLTEGVGYPAIHAMLPQLVPSSWLNAMVAVVNSMSYVGGVAALLLSGPLAERLGWPAIFHVFGVAGLVWIIPWLAWLWQYGSEVINVAVIKGSFKVARPSDSTSQNEVVNNEPGPSRNAKKPSKKEDDEKEEKTGKKTDLHDKTPWKKLLTSAPVWAFFTAGYCNCWGFWMILSWLPTYFRERFGVSLEDLGYLSVLPYAMQGIVGMAAGFGGDALLARGLISKRVLRMTAQSIAMLGPTGLLLGLLGAKTLPQAAAMVTLAMALNALSTIGSGVNHFDLAPRHAGLLFGMGNTVAVLPGILGVPLTGWMLESNGGNWGPIFALAAVHYIVGLAVWIAFGSVNPVIID